MKGEVLVKARVVRDASGSPTLMYGMGDNQSRTSRPLSTREKIGRYGGGLVGVLGALTGKHRSLGGLINAINIGHQSGASFGQGLGSMATTKKRKGDLEIQGQLQEAQRQEDMRENFGRRVRRAQEAQDRIDAPIGANTQGVVSQLRDKVRVRRTPESMRNRFNQIEQDRLDAETRRGLTRQQTRLGGVLAEQGYTPEQLQQFRQIADPATLDSLLELRGILQPQGQGGNIGSYAAVSSRPTLRELAPNAQQVPQGPIPPPQGGVANEEAQHRQMHPSGNADNFDHDAEVLNQSSPNTPEQLGRELVTQEEPANVGQLSADQLERLLLLGQQNQQTGQTQ
jgi:hypothetical protein